MRMPKFSYLVSNRSASSPDDTLGPVTYQRAPNHLDRPYKSEGFESVAWGDWAAALITDLHARYDGSDDPWDLAFYVHGFETSEAYGRKGLESLGLALTSVGFDRGLLVGVSWPSDTWLYSSAQTNARGSNALMGAVAKTIKAVQSTGAQVRVSLFCHSMGNYLAGYTMANGAALPHLDSLFLLAADVDNTLWQSGTPSAPLGDALAAAATQVYVFYTANDTVLRESGIINDVTRLGYSGAAPGTTVPGNVAQLDYSGYGNDPYCLDYVPYSYYATGASTGSLVHSSSKFVPDLLSLFRACMVNVPPGRVDVSPTRDFAKLRRLFKGKGAPEAKAPRARAAKPAKKPARKK